MASHPFPVTPDEVNYFFAPEIEAIFEEVTHFIAMRKGFLLLTGEIGLGKTTFLRRLLASFDKSSYNTALILTSFLDQAELLETIVRDFGLSLPPDARRIDHLTMLNQFLLAEAEKGKISVLFIDDAQALDAQALDVVRQLSNLETAQSKLIQVVLCGQPELLDTLDQRSLRQVKSRIALHRQLQALGPEQSLAYIRHRLDKAGCEGCIEITPDGLEALLEWSAGIPRRIHQLMDRCLYGMLASGAVSIDRALVLRALADLGWQGAVMPPVRPPPVQSWLRRPRSWILLLMTVAISGAATAWFFAADYFLPHQPIVNAAKSTPAIFTQLPAPAPLAKPKLIAEPSDWSTARAAFPGLASLVWPAVGNLTTLTKEILKAPPMRPWQVLLGQGKWVKPCAERPLLTVLDEQGASWQLSFVESWWPISPVPMGDSSDPVRQVQQLMVQQRWLQKTEVDAVMGPRTAYALSQFQREQGLRTTGQFSPETVYRLACQLAAHVSPAAPRQ
jgi:general secretion pathway protein A